MEYSSKICTNNRFTFLFVSFRSGIECLNYIRDKKVEENYRNETELVSEDFFYNVLLEEELFIRLRGAINELPEKYKEVISLNLEGLE